MALVAETFIKRWDKLPEKRWDVCESYELKKGDIIRVFERYTKDGRWFLKKVNDMSLFTLLADAKPDDILVGAWFSEDMLRFLEEEDGGETNNERL